MSLVVVQNDEIVYTLGYGIADPDGMPVTPNTPFILGSCNKSFTALAIMQLVEAGEIELDAPVQRYLPLFTMLDPEDPALITIRHLLAQTSGLSGPVSNKDLCSLQSFRRPKSDQKTIPVLPGPLPLKHRPCVEYHHSDHPDLPRSI